MEDLRYRTSPNDAPLGLIRDAIKNRLITFISNDVPAWLVPSDFGPVVSIRDCRQGLVEPRAQGPLSYGPLAQGRINRGNDILGADCPLMTILGLKCLRFAR